MNRKITTLSALIASVCLPLVACGGVEEADGQAVGSEATAETSDASPDTAYSCSAGYFCIYNGWSGSGERCQWSQSSVSNTANDCSWIQRGWLVRSVYNRTNHRVQYYTQDNYNHRVGSTPSGGRGSLEGTYQIRSFQPE